MGINETFRSIIDHVGVDAFNTGGIIIFIAFLIGLARLAWHIAGIE